MISRKAKLADTIIKEIREYVKPLVNPQNFINKTLIPLADSFEQVKRTSYTSTNPNRASEVNKLFKWLNRIDNSDWIPPAILYLSKNCNDSEKLVYFFTDLERLTAGLMIKRANINERIGRYGRLLTAIEKEEDLYTSESPLQLTSEERNDILDILKKDLYLIEKIRLYVLLRLDAALAGGDASYNFPTITVEHVLPQSPAANSVWVQWFPDQKERGNFVHLLGNLLLLSRKKNSEAQNYDFTKKKQTYFTSKTGVANFALTTQVLMEQEWTPEVINKRQKQLIDKLKEVWRL
ncbi:MAG: HNH endonuclease family protein [Nostoc sp.]